MLGLELGGVLICKATTRQSIDRGKRCHLAGHPGGGQLLDHLAGGLMGCDVDSANVKRPYKMLDSRKRFAAASVVRTDGQRRPLGRHSLEVFREGSA